MIVDKPIFKIYFYGMKISKKKELKKLLFRYRKYFEFEYDELNHHIKNKVGYKCVKGSKTLTGELFEKSNEFLESFYNQAQDLKLEVLFIKQ